MTMNPMSPVKVAVAVLALASSTFFVSANDLPALTPADFKRASGLQMQSFHAGDIRGVRAVTASYAPPSPIFGLLAAARPETDPPFETLKVVQHATLVIDETRYRMTVLLFPLVNSRLFFSVAPEAELKRATFFSLAPEQSARLSEYFRPAQ